MENISSDKVCFIIAKARQFSAKEQEIFPDRGSNPADEEMRVVLQQEPGAVAQQELMGAIHALNEDERVELYALVLLGRGDYDLEQWDEAKRVSRDNPDNRSARHLSRMPLLGDHLMSGLTQLGFDCG